ncbi:hypothetical protein GCM10009760_25770 [Kitasatospora kazusensis]|uniref:DUF2637 domain-containing protein n=1 Tax=Kitasatospora kazusensis TaxID=407974 RepID=A0ABP5L6D2_9ACTN
MQLNPTQWLAGNGTSEGIVRVGLPFIVAVNGILSFSELQHLGEDAGGWKPQLAAGLPLSIDAYSLIATVAWLKVARTPAQRKHAAAGALVSAALSVAGNLAEHLHQFGALPVSVPLVSAVSVVPTLIMVLAVHLAVMLIASRPAPDTADAVSEAPVGNVRKTRPARDRKRAVSDTEWKTLTEAEKLRRAEEAYSDLLQGSGKPTGDELGKLLGVTDRTGRTYLRKVANATPSRAQHA